MKNLPGLFNECFQMLYNLSIPYGENISFSYNKRITKKWGYCRKVGNRFEISIASVLGEDGVPDKAIKSVILHELLHTCPGCFNHGKRWKSYAKLIKAKYGIKIRTTSDAEDMNIEKRYYIKCRKCKSKIRYAMRPRNQERYCPICGSAKLTCFYKDSDGKQKLWKRG